MKIAHISDIHWRGISRHKEYVQAFERLFEELRHHKPDLIVNTGDTFHTKTQGITPEIIERLAWMFRSLADIAPSYTILGNHDGNLTNLYRKDTITPIHESIAHPRAHLLRESGTFKLSEKVKGKDVHLCVYSPFDQKGWPKVKPIEGAINIALYHGSVAGSLMDNNWKMPEGIAEAVTTDFAQFDFTLLGDIHKHQTLAQRKDKNGKLKPWMAYPGSLIQQNFGESEKKGYLIWDIKDKDDWSIKFHELENRMPFITIGWEGSVENTLQKVKDSRGTRAFLKGSRFRVSSSSAIPSVEARKLVHSLREEKKASEVVFKYNMLSRMDHVSTNDNLKISKKSLRQDPDAVVRLYLDYLTAHIASYNFDRDAIEEADQLIRGYMSKLMIRDSDKIARTTNWSIKYLEFDNIFRYGEGNKIDFSDLEGIVGIFGPNKIGKSSIVGALMYVLYNTTDRGPMKNAHIINRRKNWCRGKVRINVGGTDYIVERKSTRVVPKKKTSKRDPNKTTTTLNFYRIERDEVTGHEKKVVMNSVTRDDTDKEIRKLVGTSNDFLLTALSSQGSVDRFIKEGPTERKKILARFLELDIFDNLYYLCKDDYSGLNTRGNSLSPQTVSNQIVKTRKIIAQGENEVGSLEERLRKLREQKDSVKLWLMHHEKNAADVDLAHMEELERKVIAGEKTVKAKSDSLVRLKSGLKSNETKLKDVKADKKKIDVVSLKEQLEEFESLKSLLHELRAELNSHKAVLNNQKKNIKKLEVVPCGDQFPDCHYIKDGHRDKKKVKTQEELVKKLTSQYEINEKTFEEYVAKKLREQITTHQTLDRQEFDLIRTIESSKKHRELLKKEFTSTKLEVKKIKDEISSLKKKVNVLEGKEYEKKKIQLDKCRQLVTDIETRRQETLVKLGGKKEGLKNLIMEEEETKSLIGKLKIYDSILSAFSKTGIPAMVLKSQLPAINEELSKILEGITDFKIGLETDINSNVMDVYIQDEHSQRIIELASGMEKTIASMALRAALINLSSLPKPDVLIIDEGFGALDENNIQSCMDMLTFLRGYFKTILVISHVTPVKEVAERMIEVKNDGIESKVLA